MRLADIAADLTAEQAALDNVMAGLTEDQWELPSASPRWSVSDQVGHLTYFDGTAALAITDAGAFQTTVGELLDAARGGNAAIDDFTLGGFRALDPPARLEAWRTNRRGLAEAAATLDEDARVPWYGPPMSARSFLTARLMETWAHGQDVVDAVGVQRPATDRLHHVAQLGYITRKWSYTNRGLEVPEGEIRLELTSPSGEQWIWGPEAGPADLVRGNAEDFCLVVTQRRHVDDTALECGDLGRDWLLKAQAFAGPATDAPEPGARR